MYRGELLFFLLVLEFFSIDFFKVGTKTFFDFTTLPPKITQWEIDSCTRTIFIQAVAGGIPPYDFYVFKQDSLDSSNWQVYRLVKEQLPHISGLPPGRYRVKAVNEGVSSPSYSTNSLEVSFPADPEIQANGSISLCSGESPTIELNHAHSEGTLPILWTAELLLAPEDGELLGYTSNPTVSQFKISDSLINTGKTLAKVSYQLQALINGCIRPTGMVEVEVNPLARIEASLSDNILCSGTPFSISLLPQSWGASSIQVRWSAAQLSGQVSGLSEGGLLTLEMDASISQTLVNRGPSPARVRYTFVPSFNGCDGIAESLEVLLLPEPQVSQQEDMVRCAGEWVSLPEFTSNFTGDSVAYSWEVSDPSLGLSSGTGRRIPDFQAINSSTSSKQVLIAVTPSGYFQGASCTGPTHTFSITVRAPLLIEEELSDYAGFGISCAGAADGKIKLQLSGGLLPGEELSYRFAWTGPGGFLSSLPSLERIQAGVYRVQVAVGDHCVLEKSMELTQPEPLQIFQSQVNNVCFQGISGSLLVTPLGGVTPYSYAWEGPNGYSSRLPNPQNLVSGSYQVTVTDANGCTLTGAAQTITEPTKLSLSQSTVNNVCFQGNTASISISASGGTAPYSFAWTGPSNFSSTKEDLFGLVSGTYQVTVTDANGCTITGAAQTIIEPAQLTLRQSKVDNTCYQGNAGSISITASGGRAPYTYVWTGPTNFSSTNEDLSGLVSGTYQVNITDANGCMITGAAQTITEPTQLALSQRPVNNLCFQGNTGSIAITASGGAPPYSYAWSGPNNYSSRVANPQNLVSGTYQVTVTDANGCILTGAPQTITEPKQLGLTQSKLDNSCFQGNIGSISITASGGIAPYTYSWTGPLGFTSTNDDLSGLVSGTYQVTVRDANGCAALLGPQITITEPLALRINAEIQFESCAGARDGRIELTLRGGTPPYALNWDHGDRDALASGLGAGTYRVRVTDQAGCSQVGEYTLLPTPPLILQTSTTLQATQVSQQISALLQANAIGGTPPYTYRWSTGQTSSQIEVAQSGIYRITVKDSQGCSLESQVVVNLPLPMNLSLQVNTVWLCEEGGQETSVQLQLTGGLAPYQITWSRGVPSPDGRVLVTRESGVFDVEVKDALGLMEKRSFTIVPRLTGALDFSYLFASQAEFQGDLVGFDVNFSPQATWPFTVISWDFGDGSSSAAPSPSHRYAKKGSYLVTLTVLDESGCIIKSSQEIQVLDYFLEIPNVFTPNGDELNDTFFPKFRFIRNLQLQVMNKWGELIYRSHSQEDPGWDGTAAGQKAPEGVYVYKLRYQVPDGRTITSSSTFLLAR